jgi:hypothetical protein
MALLSLTLRNSTGIRDSFSFSTSRANLPRKAFVTNLSDSSLFLFVIGRLFASFAAVSSFAISLRRVTSALMSKQRPQLGWLGATSAVQWFDVLRIKTPLGGIYLSAAGRKQDTAIAVDVVDLAGTSTHHIGKNPEYYYPHDMPILQKVESISEIESTVAEIKGDPSTRLNRLNDKFRRLDAMYEVWSREDVLADPVLTRNLDDDQKILVEKHNLTVCSATIKMGIPRQSG